MRSDLSKDTIYEIFANLPDLLDFQRRFLISLEGTLSLGPDEQRVGAVFMSNVVVLTLGGWFRRV